MVEPYYFKHRYPKLQTTILNFKIKGLPLDVLFQAQSSAIFNLDILNYYKVWESGIQLYKLRTAIMWKTNNHDNVVDDDDHDDDNDDIQNNQGRRLRLITLSKNLIIIIIIIFIFVSAKHILITLYSLYLQYNTSYLLYLQYNAMFWSTTPGTYTITYDLLLINYNWKHTLLTITIQI